MRPLRETLSGDLMLKNRICALIEDYEYKKGEEYSPEYIIMSNSSYSDGDFDFNTAKNEELVAVLREVLVALDTQEKGGQ